MKKKNFPIQNAVNDDPINKLIEKGIIENVYN